MTTAQFTPADQSVRDAIAMRVGENMLVEAGAGTGKTTVLVDRIVHILASGHAEVHQLVVITFTEKAAAELAARVRQGLERALATAATGQERERIATAIRDLNRAHIETIHAFAASLLRERPIEAGLDPGFEVLDVLPAQLEFDAAWDEWLTAETASDTPPPALVHALNVGLDFANVRAAALALNTHRDLLPLDPYPPVAVDPAAALRELGEHVAELRAMTGRCVNPGDGALANIHALADTYDEMLPLAGRADALARAICLTGVTARWTNAGTQGNWRTPDDCRTAKAAIKEAIDALREARSRLRQDATARLVEWLARFVTFYDGRRREAGKADFDDLLIWARDLVRGNAEVRAYFQSKYRAILVDEFQDTDPLQVEMIVSLCSEGDLPPDWRDATVRPGSLFVVGDPKQSIYRFRRADIAMYDAVKRRIFANAPRLITQNFRSARPIIDWVNGAFEILMHEREGVQPPYVPLDPHPDLAASDAVTVVRAPSPTAVVADIRRTEAELIASLIRSSVASAAWIVRDRDDNSARPATFRDVVVLVPSRTEIHIYEDALARAGVPYRHEGGRTFFQRQEVRELIAILRAIDDPGDAVATVAALRSSAFGCSDEDLLLYRVNNGGFNFFSVRDDAAGPVADSLRALRDLARKRHTTPLPVLVRDVLDTTRMVEFAMLQPQGEQVAANLLKVIDQARAFAEASNAGLRGFVRWLRENTERQADETDAPVSEETDDVVRILTIHAAKGLEFPVVVFANMGTRHADRTTVIADREARHLHVKLGKSADGFRTPGFDAAADREAVHADAEDMRTLYVAATRARDRLVMPFVDVPAKSSDKTPDTLSAWLRSAGADQLPPLDTSALPPVDADLPVWRREPPQAAVDATAVIEERGRWLAARDALLERARRPLVVHTASALKPEWTREAPGGDDVRRGRATDFGSAVHALLERVDLAVPTVDPLAHAIAEEFGLLDREREIADVARRALDSDAVARARRSPRVLREVPFTLALPGDIAGVAEGRIDLLFEEDGALVVADFKTDAVTREDAAARAAFYKNQALIYAWAAATTTNLRVREVIFIFARPTPAEAFTYAVDAAFMADAKALVGREPVAQDA